MKLIRYLLAALLAMAPLCAFSAPYDPVSSTVSATGYSSSFSPKQNTYFNIRIDCDTGSAVGTWSIRRSTDNGATWFELSPSSWYQGAATIDFSQYEPGAGVAYAVYWTKTSGTLYTRMGY